MKATFGTSHFVSLSHAESYYAAMGYSSQDVASKIKAGEISIGEPALQQNDSLSINGEGRYVITR